MKVGRIVSIILRHIFSLRGRANRSEFIFWLLALVGSSFLITWWEKHYSVKISPFFAIPLLIIIIGLITSAVRRLHDLNASGLWLVVWFVPFANFILAIRLVAGPSTRGPNKYGLGAEDHRISEVF